VLIWEAIVYPEDDAEVGGGIVDFVGSWSSYGLFESGWILINTIERGVYSVRYTGERKYEYGG